MNWIRISTDIMDDPSIHAIAEALRISTPTAVGGVVGVLLHLPTHAREGDVAGVTDRTIEAWAQWTGKRGAFAAAFRAHLCDTQGVVRSWEKHNGAAIRESDRARERVKAWREQKRTGSVPRTKGVTNGERTRGRDGTGRDELPVQDRSYLDADVGVVPPTASKKRPRPAEPIVQAFESCQHTVLPHHYDALAELLETVPSPHTWAGIMIGMHQGVSAPNNRPTEPARLGSAVQDFVASGKHRHGNPGLFRGFVARAKAPPTAQTGYTDLHTMRADDLRELRAANERRRQLGQPLKVEPADADVLDAMFPDGRTRPPMVAA